MVFILPSKDPYAFVHCFKKIYMIGDFMRVFHSFPAIYDKNSKVLILGSMPSVKSRENGFYYAHPRNRFWSTLESVYQEKIGSSKEEKVSFLQRHGIALFDVLKSCDISSSSDSSIKNPVCNDLRPILATADILAIFTTGRKAYELYQKYCYFVTGIPAILLPSPSPANCSKGIDERLILEYQKIRDFTDL